VFDTDAHAHTANYSYANCYGDSNAYSHTDTNSYTASNTYANPDSNSYHHAQSDT
jgi:hypothetical protein